MLAHVFLCVSKIVFFFQAEDGIRDVAVTGVQTCALPISPGTRFTPPPRGRELAGGLLLGALVAVGFISVTLGLVITTPSRSAFIVAISSVLAPVIGFVVLGQRPAWFTAAALAVAGLGMYFLTAPDAGGLNRGDLLTLICALDRKSTRLNSS